MPNAADPRVPPEDFDPEWWQYEKLESGFPYDWSPAQRGTSPFDNIDFHLDLGCGTLKKARLGIDRHWAPGVDLIMDLEHLTWIPAPATYGEEAMFATQRSMHTCQSTAGMLPFPDESIESIISHHCMEHISGSFLHLMDECWRVLKPGGLVRIIVPLFPSTAAVEDPDHKRYFMENTFATFEGAADGSHWHEGFSVPYTDCRFEIPEENDPENPDRKNPDITPRNDDPAKWWTAEDVREIRVALRKRAA
jgi:SAM-dependent methyltransferase